MAINLLKRLQAYLEPLAFLIVAAYGLQQPVKKPISATHEYTRSAASSPRNRYLPKTNKRRLKQS